MEQEKRHKFRVINDGEKVVTKCIEVNNIFISISYVFCQRQKSKVDSLKWSDFGGGTVGRRLLDPPKLPSGVWQLGGKPPKTPKRAPLVTTEAKLHPRSMFTVCLRKVILR